MLSRLEEFKLVSQCALADNRCAFGRLVEAYQPRLRRFLLNLTLGNESLTDDLAQETFLKAYLGIRSFKGFAGFGTWLFRIAYNEFYNEKRRKHEEDVEVIGENLQATSLEDVDANEALLTVQAAMSRLGDVERTVITLFYIEDQTIKKISSITGMPEGTIKSALHRGKEKMKKMLGNQL